MRLTVALSISFCRRLASWFRTCAVAASFFRREASATHLSCVSSTSVVPCMVSERETTELSCRSSQGSTSTCVLCQRRHDGSQYAKGKEDIQMSIALAGASL
ncbi:unnamed protein product [Prorocentrum cordatum]|uniref:Secreted protein n=1 Tax=Prorocentrum cordatum TaxID=2364126 RepID=A0ABN9WX56_9DINO|nr:unnamed protein product [Polarella glacialis]